MIKELDDYLGIIQEKYPKISKDELKRVIEHGFSSFHLLAKSGADVVLGNHNYTAFVERCFLMIIKELDIIILNIVLN